MAQKSNRECKISYHHSTRHCYSCKRKG